MRAATRILPTLLAIVSVAGCVGDERWCIRDTPDNACLEVPAEPCASSIVPVGECDSSIDTACHPRTSCANSAIFAAPEGKGESCSQARPCALNTAQLEARARVPAQRADIVVYLRGGTYRLADSGPVQLDPTLDSGRNGFAVVYRAYPDEIPVLSGARAIGPWSLIDTNKNIYRAESRAPGSRHLTVGGSVARRARGAESPGGFSKTASGYVAPDDLLASLRFPEVLEMVGYREWKSFRCSFASIAGRVMTVSEACWRNSHWHIVELNLPQWFENAPELLDTPGEFFRAPDGSVVDYIPLPSQDLVTVDAVEPVLTQLIVGAGEPGSAVHDLRFEGLTFADTTWDFGADGFSELQAGMHVVDGSGALAKMPAALSFNAAERVSFIDNHFTRLAAAGLSFGPGSKSNEVWGGLFDELGGIAIQVGDVRNEWHHHPATTAEVTNGNVIRDVSIRRIGLDFPGSPAIWVGYAERTEVRNNELVDLPYTGISVGWGWGQVDVGGSAGYTRPAACGQNVIAGNRIRNFLSVLRDGGAIYLLGAQPMSLVEGNYVDTNVKDGGGIYLDNGAQHYVVRGNVVQNVRDWLLCQYLPAVARNNQIIDNFTQLDGSTGYQATAPAPHPSNVVSNNITFGLGVTPEIRRIIDASGPGGVY